MDTTWIDTPEALQQFCSTLDDVIAVDTESDHFHAYQAQVCLIQVATGEAAALIDPLALDADQLAPLFARLEAPDVVTIMHAGRNDIIELDRDYGVEVANLFDTQIAARFLGYERNSLSWLQEELLGVKPGGQYQRFDWTTRPIPDKAAHYAAEDVRHLLALRERFVGELEADQWLAPFDQQCRFVATSVEHEPKAFDPEGWRTIRGADDLDGRGRAALRALYLWRHELCTELNRSAVTLFKNSAVMKLARERPTRASDITHISGLPAQIAQNRGEAIVEVIARSLDDDIPAAELPRTPYEPPPAQEKAVYNALRRWRNKKSDQLDVPGPFIATNATCTEISQNPPRTLAELAEFAPILDWHIELLGDEMLRVIADAL